MQNGICPKCDSKEVYCSDASGIQHGLSINRSSPLVQIFKENKWIPDVSMLELNYYLCRSCRYFEMYVRDIDQLSKLGDCTNWRKVERNT